MFIHSQSWDIVVSMLRLRSNVFSFLQPYSKVGKAAVAPANEKATLPTS